MATTPILTLIDALASHLTTLWGPTSPSSVERVYLAPLNVDSVLGRKVYLFPADYSDEPASRAENLNSYTVGVIVTERYTDAGEPTVAWVDTRVDFVFEKVVRGLEFLRTPGPEAQDMLNIGSREIITASREPVQVYDPAMLSAKKLFWSELEFVFQEIA